MTPAVFPLALPPDLLALLAQPEDPAVALRDQTEAPLADLAGALPAWLAQTVLMSPPADSSDRLRWLEQLDRVARAQAACAGLDTAEFPWAPGLGRALDLALAAREAGVRAIEADEGIGLRARAAASGRGQRHPWAWLPGLLEGGPHEAAFEAWAQGQASADEARELRQRVAEDERWQSAYRAFLADIAGGGVVPSAMPGASARSVLPLPHLGPGAVLHVVVTDEGTRWAWPGSQPLRLGPDATVACFEGDAITGALHIPLALDTTPLAQAWGALGQLRALTGGEVDEAHALPIACSLANQLASPAWVGSFEAAHARHDVGDALDDELSAWVSYGLEARVRLEALAAELLAPELFDALERVDALLGPHGPALGVLDEQEYTEAIAFGGLPRGWARWREEDRRSEAAMPIDPLLRRWARQKPKKPVTVRFDEEIEARLAHARLWGGASLRLGPDPQRVASMTQTAAARSSGVVGLAASDDGSMAHGGSDDVLQRIEALRAASRAEQAPAFQQVQRALQRTPCPWLREDLRTALAQLEAVPQLAELAPTLRFLMRPAPGCAPLLVAIAGSELGDVWQLRLQPRPHHEPGDPWERAPQLRATARDAIRAAFTVASSSMPQGLPRYAFEDHVIELVGGALPVEGLDGDSLGLSAALAFASLWLDLPLSDDVAATAALRRRDRAWRPGPVGYVGAKAEALGRLRAGRTVRLLVAKPADKLPAGVEAVVVATFDEALEHAGLAGPEARYARESYRPRLPLLADRLRLLRDYHEQVNQQDLAPYRGQGADPWLVLGDRIRTLVRSLDGATDAASRKQAAESRVGAALAFTHALDADGVDDMLAGVDVSLVPPSLAVYLRIVELGALIDDCTRGKRPWGEGEPLVEALDRALAALPTADRTNLEGRALGTQGRFWMHQYRLDRALPLLRAAVASHDDHLPQESGRSRIYLATALRLGGELAAAARTLDEATGPLDRCEREWSAPYAAQTRLFWGYELTRLLLDMGRPEDAIAVGEQHLPRTRQAGLWPQAGLLRTLAWAYQVVGREAEQKATLEALRACAGSDSFLRRLVREAEGGYRQGGEVY